MADVDYNHVAPVYDRRYELERYEGIRASLDGFLSPSSRDILEVGCGTGQWLAEFSPGRRGVLAGIDSSQGMLAQAHAKAVAAGLVRATACALPFLAARFERIFCVNALHHFPDHPAFFREAYRVLRPGGGILSIGMDPHAGRDSWWIYDFFPSARQADEARFPPSARLHAQLAAAGFTAVQTKVAQHLCGEASFEVARARGFVDRRATSQLLVISDDEYCAGLRRMEAMQPTLRANLFLYATTASKGAVAPART